MGLKERNSAPETVLLQTVLGFYLSRIQSVILLTAFKCIIKEGEKKREIKLNLKIHSIFSLNVFFNVLSATVLPSKSQELTIKCSLCWRSFQKTLHDTLCRPELPFHLPFITILIFHWIQYCLADWQIN